jgi:hypothetical protein
MMVVLFIKSEFLQKQKSCRFRQLILQISNNMVVCNFIGLIYYGNQSF